MLGIGNAVDQSACGKGNGRTCNVYEILNTSLSFAEIPFFLCYGQGASFNVTGSQLDVGSSENTFSCTLNDGTLSLLIMIRKRERNLSDLSDRSALFDPSDRSALFDPSDRSDRSDRSAKKPSFLFSIQGVAAEGVPERSEGNLPRKNRAMILFPA